MDKLAERSTQPLTRCWQTGREDSAEDNETCSRPPTDLRGSSCGMRQPSTGSGAVGLCSRSHRRSGILPVPGMRGKYGTQQSYREPPNRAFLSYDSPNHSGAAAPSFVDLNGKQQSRCFWSSWPEVGQGQRTALLCRPFTFPHGQRETIKSIHIADFYRRFSDDGDKSRLSQGSQNRVFPGQIHHRGKPDPDALSPSTGQAQA